MKNYTPSDHIGEQLEGIVLFSNFTNRQRARLGGALVPKKYKDGDVVCEKFKEVKGVYIIKRGTAELHTVAEDGNPQTQELKKRDVFG